jgi:hypothetical protein
VRPFNYFSSSLFERIGGIAAGRHTGRPLGGVQVPPANAAE